MNKSKQSGASLVELLVASMLGIIAIGIVGTIFVNGQRVATERTKDLSLLQSTNSVLQIMKLDMHRAGFNGKEAVAVKLSGANHVYHVKNDTDSGLVAYAYASEVSGANVTQYTNVVYEQRSGTPDILRYCEKKGSSVVTTAQAEDTATHFAGVCNTLFHTNRIIIEEFNPTITTLPGTTVSSAMVTVQLSTKLKNDTSVEQSLTFKTKQRNW